MADDFALRVEDIEGHFVFRRGLKVVIDDRARGRILAGRLAGSDFAGIMQAHRGLRLVEHHLGLRGLRIDLAQRGHVVEHPEGAAMSRHDEVVIFHHQIVDRRGRQIHLQRLPMRAVIERNINAELGAGVEQAAAFRIFAHGVDVGAVGDSVGDGGPALAGVAGLDKCRA